MNSEILHRVIYSSVPKEGLERDDIEAILHTSQRRNAETRITGALVYGPGSFMQVLEGPPREIDSLIKSIKKDSRHTQMVVQFLDAIVDREFGDWAMAYVGAEEAVASLDGIVSIHEVIARMKSDEGIVAVLIEGLRQELATH